MAKNCLASVINTVDREKTEIIVVDNGSEVKSDWSEADRYIDLGQNTGISCGWNTGLRVSKGKYKVILGDDTLMHGNWLEELRKCFDQPKCGVANVHMEHLPQGVGIKEDYKWFSGACFMLTQDTIDKVGYFDEEIWPCNTEDWDYWIRTYKAGLKLYKNFGISLQHKEGQTVHSEDLSKHTQVLLKRLTIKHGFDPIPVFCGDMSIHKALQ